MLTYIHTYTHIHTYIHTHVQYRYTISSYPPSIPYNSCVTNFPNAIHVYCPNPVAARSMT